jgi:hypothetical protein
MSGPEPNPVPPVAGEWSLRPFFQKGDPEVIAQERALYEYQLERWKAVYRFAEPWGIESRDEMHRVYRDEVEEPASGMGCMAACYKGLEVLYPDRPKYDNDPKRESLRKKVYDISVKDKKFNSVDLMMDTLRKEGRAGDPLTVQWDRKAKAWDPPAEKELLSMFDPTQKGVYFFGLSVAKGNHTVLLSVDNTGPTPKVFWLDQHTRGVVKDVTGELDKKLGAVWKDPNLPNRIWPLKPVQMSKADP